MPNQPTLLALDIGTSSTRALLYTANGTPIPGVHAQQTYTLTTSHAGEASVDADLLVDLVARTIDEVLHTAGQRAENILGVATSAFWHTLVPLDIANRPLMPLMTWEDTRPQQAATALRARLAEQAIHQRTGARLHTSYWPAKIAWLASTYPELVQRTARYVSFGEYLHTCLLGRAVCSLSMASGTGLLNRHTQTWDTELRACLPLSPQQLPTIGDISETLHGLQPAFAARWPMLNNVPWFPAIGDGAAANLGSNCTVPSIWAVTMGTSSAMRVVVPQAFGTPQEGLWLYAVDQRRALLGSALSEGGNVLAWLQRTLQLPDLRTLDQQLASLAPTAHGLTILPMLAGERAPGWHADAHMTLTGLTLHTTPAEIALAALEAVVFQLSSIYEQLAKALASHVEQPRLIANGTALLNSSVLPHIVADTLNRPLELTEESEASARGAALLALETLGILPDLAQRMPRVSTVVQPDPDRHALYTEARTKQQRLYNLLLA